MIRTKKVVENARNSEEIRSVTVRMESKIYFEIAKIADVEDRSINMQIIQFIKEGLRRYLAHKKNKGTDDGSTITDFFPFSLTSDESK